MKKPFSSAVTTWLCRVFIAFTALFVAPSIWFALKAGLLGLTGQLRSGFYELGMASASAACAASAFAVFWYIDTRWR